MDAAAGEAADRDAAGRERAVRDAADRELAEVAPREDRPQGLVMAPEVFRHAMQLAYGAPRPPGHERCVLCCEWFGRGRSP